MIKPKPKAAFLIKIALPSSFPKGILICKNLLSLAVVSNWALLTSPPIILVESKMRAHQLRGSGDFRGSPGLLPLATPHFLFYHPTSFQPQLHLLFPSKAWERDRQVHIHHHLVHHSSVGSGFAEIPCHTLSKCKKEKGRMPAAWEGLRAPLFLFFSWAFPTKPQPNWKLSYVFLCRFPGEVFIAFYYFLCRNL